MEADEQYRNLLLLWGSVVLQTVQDHLKEVKTRGAAVARRREPARWLLDDSPRPGGFIWACYHLDIDAHALRREMDNPSLLATVRRAMDMLKGSSATTPKRKEAPTDFPETEQKKQATPAEEVKMKSSNYDFLSDQVDGRFLKAWAVSTFGMPGEGSDDDFASWFCFDGV